MGRKQRFKWKETAVAVSTKDTMLMIITNCVITIVCACLFMLSAGYIASDLFEWLDFSMDNLWKMCIGGGLFALIMEVSWYTKKWLGYVLRWGLLVIAAAVGVFLFLQRRGNIQFGIAEAVSNYLMLWNDYYGTDFLTSSLAVNGTVTEHVMLAAEYIFGILFFLFLWEAKMLHNNKIMVLLPLIPFVLELLVGLAPEAAGYFWGFAVILSFIIKGIGISSAEKIIKNAPFFMEFQENLENEIEQCSLPDLWGGYLNADKEKLSNDTPEYENIPLFEMEMEYKPLGNIYLRGFYGDTYKNNTWKQNQKAYKRACKDAGFDHKQVSEELAYLLQEKMVENYVSGISTAEDYFWENKTTLSYLEKTGTRAFFPYFFKLDQEEVKVEGDSWFKKRRNLTEVSFSTWYYEGQYEKNLNGVSGSRAREWEDWYEDYAEENYLDVPENMPNVKKIADELSERELLVDLGNVSSLNEERYSKAYLVSQWMESNTSYTLTPPELPADTDPVEFFLGKSKSGYCMHYASAAVLILREMGVPARYASGYVVNQSDFLQTESGYTAIIRDNRAHAWVEIYLNDIGWVPVEVTKGYRQDVFEYVTDESAQEAQREQEESQQKESEESWQEQKEDSEEQNEKPQEQEEQKSDTA